MDRRGCRQETVGTQSFEGKPERLERGQGKKRGKYPENGADWEEKEVTGAKIRVEGGSALLNNWSTKGRLRKKMNGSKCEEIKGQVRR